jgi:hypothetical protein
VFSTTALAVLTTNSQLFSSDFILAGSAASMRLWLSVRDGRCILVSHAVPSVLYWGKSYSAFFFA